MGAHDRSMTNHLPRTESRILTIVSLVLFMAAPIVGAQQPGAARAGSEALLAPAELAAGADLPSPGVARGPRSVADQVKLANDYLAGQGVVRDPRMAAYWYEKAAGADDPVAQLEIGYFYETGTGVERDPERAAHWYELAASGGSPLAKVNLGVVYLWGIGVPKNERLAFELMNEAAAQGSGLAACYLGDFYFFGVGVPQNKGQAERWYRKGASLHNPIAEFDLATMLMDAGASLHDLSTAAKLLRHAVASGYVPAMHELGLLLVRNPDLAQSPGEAAGLLNDAAAAGNWRSSMLLGVMARDGNGATANNETAYYHFRVAALQGGEEAQKLLALDLRLLVEKLGADRVRAIDAEAGQWCLRHQISLAFVAEMKENQPGFLPFALVAPDRTTHAAQMLITASN